MLAKDKHDCFITNSNGGVLFKVFTITNNLNDFNKLYHKIKTVIEDVHKVKVGLEHYILICAEKGLSLRKKKTDKVDARTIASMVMAQVINSLSF